MTDRPEPRRTLFAAVGANWPRIARMGLDAIAESHAAGHPAWVEDDLGHIVRQDPDGSRHVEERSGSEVLRAARAVAVGDLTDEEVEAMTTSEIPPGHAYELDDLEEDGTWKPGRFPGWRNATGLRREDGSS